MALAFALLAACSFDADDLAERDGCRVDDDCLAGVCIDGRCARDVADAGSDTAGTCAATDRNGCGGCAALPAAPGTSCGTCGQWACAGPDEVRCDEAAACGGCDEADIGGPCGMCGTLACESGAPVCREAPTNACGGCTPLAGLPGVSCSACGGEWTCEGTERVACVGGSSNPCGGCEGPADVVLGDVCECPGTPVAAAARWGCRGDVPECGDDNDRVSDALDLGEMNDTASEPIAVDDALQLPDDIDWYTVRGIDVGDVEDGLFPRATLRSDGLSEPTVCVFWVYDDRRAWDEGCAEGVLSTWDDLFGCCAMGTVSPEVSAALVVAGSSDPRLDSTDGEGNDGGRMYAAVYDASGVPSCSPFRLDLSL